MSQGVDTLTDVLLQELAEISGITGTPVHQLLGITKEKLDEWLKEHEIGKKPMLRISIPTFEKEDEL